jgi:predicted NAD-dependent protein-ADP-ribosyltransferase YbiA (DUF1768 family)
MGETTGIVKFYSVSDNFGEFSNFAEYSIAIDPQYADAYNSRGNAKSALGNK